MLKIKTSAIAAGMEVCRPIYSQEGQLLIENGAILKKNTINRLLNYNITNVFVKWDKEISKEVRNTIILDTKHEAVNLLKQSISELQLSRYFNIERFKEIISNIVDDLLKKEGTLVNLTSIRTIDDYTFIHSLNVCVLSLVIGIAINYNKVQLESLGIGSLLHDIGKIAIEPRILNKPASLNVEEYDIIKNHSIIGYDMARFTEGLSEESITIIRDHHERYDGKGYPYGKRGNQIHEFARIVAICDVFDALTSDRIYRIGMPPHIGIEYLISMSNHQFDQELVKVFTKNITIYPIGTLIELESGERGVVVSNNEILPTRPVIEVLYDKSGKKKKMPEIINLADNLNNAIASKI